jgi:uroporphyrinogen decarboxylase
METKMTSRERITAVLQRKAVDRIPIDFGGTNETGIAAVAYGHLRRHLGIDGHPFRLIDLYQQLAKVEDEARRFAGGDVVPLAFEAKQYHPWTLPDGTPCEVPEKFGPAREPDGSEVLLGPHGKPLLRRAADGYWFDPVGPLCPGMDSIADIARFMPMIKIMDRATYLDETLEELAARAKRLYDETDYAIAGQFGGHIFAAAQLLRGMANFMCDLVADQPFARALMETLAEAHMEEFEHYIAAVGDYIQVVLVADDLGAQNGPQISPELFREVVRPPMERWYRFIKARADAKLFLHSCGSVYKLIPDLIEMGVDVLNPVQVSAADMGTARLKREFGRDIIFWGGGCDTQQVLPFGTPAQVREEVKRRIDDLGPEGFVFCQVHNVQPGVPPQNLAAMWQAAQEFGG